MGILYLAGALKQAGHECRLVLSDRDDPVRVCKEFDPDIVGFSMTTGFHPHYLEVNRRIRRKFDKPGLLTIFGGPHCTFFPEIVEDPDIDIVCRGEGEEAIVELADTLADGDDITNIQNLWIKRDGVDDDIHQNELRPLVNDLDELTWPDREILYHIDPYMREVSMKHFFNSRGCPYLCTYCFNHRFNRLYSGLGDIIRYRSVDDIIAEINDVRERYPLGMVRFLSDNFPMNKEWVEEFADKFPVEIGLPFNCHVRANQIDDERAANLAKAGNVSVLMGVETADEYLRNEVLKRKQSDEMIIRAAKRLKDNDISLYTQNIIALPGETFDMALKTVELNIECEPAFAWASIFMPYPGTELSQYAIDNGYFDGDYDKVMHTFHVDSVLRFDDEIERKMMTRLHKLFGLMVEFPFLVNIARILCRLPLGAIYSLYFKLWYGYTNRTRIFPYPITLKQYVWGVVKFFGKDEA
jgi:radical SAM superfamily enzyme YgiQ (UPF0313 family)